MTSLNRMADRSEPRTRGDTLATRIYVVLTAVYLALALLSSSCGRTVRGPDAVGPVTLREPAGSAKVLVVCYSRTGTTQRVAEELARELDADLEQIRDVRGRGGIFGFILSGREAVQRRLPEIGSVVLNPEQYELVVLGTPVWAGTMSSPMRTYITRNRDKFKAVALLCTQVGEDPGKTFTDMAELCGKPAAATLSLRRETVLKDAAGASIKEFAGKLRGF